MLSWLGHCLYRFLVDSKQYTVSSNEEKLSTSYYLLPTNGGSILIVILWSLFFLSALAVAINAYIFPQLSLAAKLRDREKMYYLAKAGTKRAILEIEKDITDGFDALKEPWSNNEDGFKEIKLGDGIFSISYQTEDQRLKTKDLRYGLVDEERKININKAPYTMLKQFFEIVGGCSSQQASIISASIIDWRDENEEPSENGAESGYYLNLKPGYPCKNKDFEVVEEVLLVKGMTQGILDKVKDRVTTYGQGAVNINTADELVLRSLGMGESLAEKVSHFRKGNDGKEATSDDNVFESIGTVAQNLSDAEGLSEEELGQLNSILGAGQLCVRSDNFRALVFGELQGKSGRFEIAFIFNRNKAIKYWREL